MIFVITYVIIIIALVIGYKRYLNAKDIHFNCQRFSLASSKLRFLVSAD